MGLSKHILDEYFNNGKIVIEEKIIGHGSKYKDNFLVLPEEEDLYQEYFKWYSRTYCMEDSENTPDSSFCGINSVAQLIHMRREWEIAFETGKFCDGYKIPKKRLKKYQEQMKTYKVISFEEWKKYIKANGKK